MLAGHNLLDFNVWTVDNNCNNLVIEIIIKGVCMCMCMHTLIKQNFFCLAEMVYTEMTGFQVQIHDTKNNLFD